LPLVKFRLSNGQPCANTTLDSYFTYGERQFKELSYQQHENKIVA